MATPEELGKELYGYLCLHGGDSDATEKVSDFLAQGAPVTAKGWDGSTCLMQAAFWEKREVIRLLLDKKPPLDEQDNEGRTALMYAVTLHRHSAMPFIEAGCDLNVKNSKGDTALTLAARWGHADVVKALLERGVDTEWRDQANKTALDHARDNKKSASILRMLEEAHDQKQAADNLQRQNEINAMAISAVVLEKDIGKLRPLSLKGKKGPSPRP